VVEDLSPGFQLQGAARAWGSLWSLVVAPIHGEMGYPEAAHS